MSRPDAALAAFFDSLPKKARTALAAAVKKEAQDLAAAQKQALQQQLTGEPETGALEASIQAVPGENDLEWIVQAGGDTTTKEVRTGAEWGFDYAAGFEFGTTRQPARPFFFPTYRERREGIEERIAAAVTEAISK